MKTEKQKYQFYNILKSQATPLAQREGNAAFTAA